MSFCAAAAAQDTGRDSLDQCLARMSLAVPEPPAEFAEIEKRCPDLRAALDDSPYASWLPEEWWGSHLNTRGLANLHEQISRESAALAPRSIDTSGVAAALASLGEEASRQVSWWDRLREWLRRRMRAEQPQSPGWLFRWLDRLGEHQTALRITAYGLFALVVIAAGVIVVNELKAAGVFGDRGRVRAGRAAGVAWDGTVRAPSLGDLERSDPLERPALLIALVVAALARSRDRAVDTSSTHRELASRIDLDSEVQQGAFGRLVNCAERVRYAATPPSRAAVDEAVDAGRRLFETISARRGTSVS